MLARFILNDNSKIEMWQVASIFSIDVAAAAAAAAAVGALFCLTRKFNWIVTLYNPRSISLSLSICVREMCFFKKKNKIIQSFVTWQMAYRTLYIAMVNHFEMFSMNGTYLSLSLPPSFLQL